MTDSVADRLAAHLRHQLGAWPPTPGRVTVAGSPRRALPGWDGHVRPFSGMKTPAGTVLSVPPELLGPVTEILPLWGSKAFEGALESLLGFESGSTRRITDDVIYRWSGAPTPGADVGEWIERADPRLPPWLRPFNGDILCAWDEQGSYGAGVGIKRHDAYGQEIAVGTEPAMRGHGIARALVSTAARRILAAGAVPTYVHEAENTASAHVADAAGFPDRGLRVIGFWPAQRQPEGVDAP